MLDIQLLRSQPAEVAARLATRGAGFDVAAFQALEDERKGLQVRTQELQAKRNALSKQIGQLKARGEDTAAAMQEVAGLGDELKQNEEKLADLLNRTDGRPLGDSWLEQEAIRLITHAGIPVPRVQVTLRRRSSPHGSRKTIARFPSPPAWKILPASSVFCASHTMKSA